jgi:hypothetical protein
MYIYMYIYIMYIYICIYIYYRTCNDDRASIFGNISDAIMTLFFQRAIVRQLIRWDLCCHLQGAHRGGLIQWIF